MDESRSLLDYFDHSFQELYSLEEMLSSFGQHQMADVLRSVVEMAYGKLSALDVVLERDIGRVDIQLDEHGQPGRASLSMKPQGGSMQ